MLYPGLMLYLLVMGTVLWTYAMETPDSDKVIQILEDDLGSENFTYYRLQRPGTLVLELISLKGDVDIYLSSEVSRPDYGNYELKSDSCGVDIIIVPSRMQRPAYVSIFGHPNYIQSKYRLTISEREEVFVEDYEYLVNKYEKYYFEEMESEMTGSPKPQHHNSESDGNNYGGEEEDDESLPLWWTILVEILKFGIEVVL